MTLSKDAIISAVAKANGYHRPQATQLVETLIEIIKSKLIFYDFESSRISDTSITNSAPAPTALVIHQNRNFDIILA